MCQTTKLVTWSRTRKFIEPTGATKFTDHYPRTPRPEPICFFSIFQIGPTGNHTPNLLIQRPHSASRRPTDVLITNCSCIEYVQSEIATLTVNYGNHTMVADTLVMVFPKQL